MQNDHLSNFTFKTKQNNTYNHCSAPFKTKKTLEHKEDTNRLFDEWKYNWKHKEFILVSKMIYMDCKGSI